MKVTGYEKTIGTYWSNLFHKQNLSSKGTVVEVAPGDTLKIGYGLAQYGFCGTYYIIEPVLSVLRQVASSYKELMPHATFIPLPYKLKASIRFLPSNISMMVANHALDDMLVGEALKERAFQKLFTNHYHAPADLTKRVWEQITHSGRIEEYMQKVIASWKELNTKQIGSTHIHQYDSYFFKQNGIQEPDYYATLLHRRLKW